MERKILWAKKSLGMDGIPKWLPLYQHLLDTQFIISMLYKMYLSDHQRNIIKDAFKNSSDESAEQLVKFIGVTHDIGKSTPAFQLKNSYQGIKKLDEEMQKKLYYNGFLSTDFKIYPLPSPQNSPHALAGEVILEKFGVNRSIGSIIGGHHGAPVNYDKVVNDNLTNNIENYYFKTQKDNSIHKKWLNIQKDLFNWALSRSGYNNVDDIPQIKSIAAQVILEGMLIMADWIASNEKYFPLFNEEIDETNNLIIRLHNGWTNWYNDASASWIPEICQSANDYYLEKFGFKPHEFQSKIFDTIKHTKNPGIVIIESGMGSGKTEASLSTVEQLAKKYGCDGLFYCLPTQATTNAMFSRVETWLDKLSEEDDENKDIQLVHGKSALNENFTKLPHKIDIDNDLDAGVMVNQWFVGSKTAILDDFVVGTVDQLLLLALKKKHLALRHLGFSGKVVVIDEAHGFDSYMQSYLCRALEWLGQYHIPVVILSATLPSSKRMDFMNSYLNKSSDNVDSKIKDSLAYPLVSYSDGNKMKIIDSFKSVSKSKKVKINYLNDNDLVSKIRDLLSDGGICGVVVNTVYRAQSLGKQLIKVFGKENVDIFHSSFIAVDRLAKEDALLDSIGKNNKKRPKLKIVIGTQVLEQSLDIDFDVMITDLAPMDLLLQRIGRLHRHELNDKLRPLKLSKSKCYVLGTSDDYEYESGASYIYGDALLMRTQFYLKDKVLLPDDISHLIQEVYNFDNSIELTSKLQKKYDEAVESYMNSIKNKRTSSKTYMIDKYSDVSNNLIGWLNNPNEQDLEKSDAAGLAQVRDGEDTVEVIMVKRNGDNDYSLMENSKPLKELILNGTSKITKKLAQNTIKLPGILTRKYNIQQTINELEKFNKDNLSNWQNQYWLRGSLGIILDENNRFPLNGYILSYDDKLGMTFEKED
ncbi:CRISPR-associated helicase Cas3' [Apilactobacillus timberlakei]|uniref:CRISPR-associated helicase Cas3' n=1 Tax=Apilactobacillus timberlakei TaxID=2008380 RepID=UPI001127527C|nr:CRISPR-associated helicase Cas3' [Apilactobacillus timberlakei]TPR19564.1 CRISPR-associated helicase Cas3' [Apilactobacillus timberlakei]